MTDELITADNVSKELIRSILDSAFIDYKLDEDGDIIAKEEVRCFIFPSKEKSKITFLTQFGLIEGAERIAVLEACNAINDQYILVKCYASKGNNVRFEYDIPLAGGITRKWLVQALKRFCGIPREAVQKHADGIVE